MVLKVAERGNIPPFIVMDVMRVANERERAKGDVLHLEVGQPGTGAPEGVIAAAEAALRGNRLGYTDSLGIPELRAEIRDHYRAWYGLDLPLDRIVATTGSSGGFLLSFLAAFNPGDRVALVEPGYPCYKNILTAVGIEPVSLPGTFENRFQPTPDLLEREGGRLDGLIVASPSNPTGTMIGSDEMRALSDYCEKKGIRLISDEIYHGIVYGEPAVTAANYAEHAVVINSFSKYFSMTGWRLGWMIVPPDLVRPIERLAQNLFISPPTLSQLAAVAAFECTGELEANVARYRENRKILLEALPGAGFESFAPADGAFYLYADIRHMTNDSNAFCQKILRETGVAVTPGVDFDTRGGNTWMRFSFCGPTEDMRTAAERLTAWRVR